MTLTEEEQLRYLQLKKKRAAAARAKSGGMVDLEATPPAREIPAIQSAGMGAAQGITSQFGDEGAALLQAIARKGKETVMGGPVVDFGEAYKGARDIYRKDFKAAKEAHPAAYLGGEIAGAVGTAALPGVGGQLSAAKLAALGGLQGLGASEAEDLGGMAADTAIGAGTGAILGKAGPVILKQAMRPVVGAGKALGWGAKKAMSAILGPSSEAIESKLARPGAIGEMTPGTADITARMPTIFKIMQRRLTMLDREATKTLRTSANEVEGATNASFLQSELQKLSDSVPIPAGEGEAAKAVVGASAHKAMAVIDKFLDDVVGFSKIVPPVKGKSPILLPGQSRAPVKRVPVGISERSMRKIIQATDDNIDWENPELGLSNRLLQDFRHAVDSKLKSGNPDYEKAMRPVQEATEKFKKAKSYFGMKKDVGTGGVEVGQSTESKIATLPGKGRSYGRSLAGELPGDIAQLAEDARLAEQFKGGATQGSRRTVSGAIIGGGIGTAVGKLVGMPGAGGMAGSGAGALVGMHLDKEGGRIAGNIIDFYVKNNPAALGKYAAPFKNAAARGAQYIAVTHQLLSERDPEYRRMLHNLTESMPE